MTEPEDPGIDRRKVRAGLALVGGVFLVALVLLLVVHDPLGRFLMFGVTMLALVRLFRLTRSVRRGE